MPSDHRSLSKSQFLQTDLEREEEWINKLIVPTCLGSQEDGQVLAFFSSQDVSAETKKLSSMWGMKTTCTVGSGHWVGTLQRSGVTRAAQLSPLLGRANTGPHSQPGCSGHQGSHFRLTEAGDCLLLQAGLGNVSRHLKSPHR